MMDKIIHTSVELNCSPAEAFRMFTDNEKLESWFAPQANVEPKLGGLYELFWNPEDKQYDSTIGCRITAFEQDKLLAFEWKGPKQFNHFMNSADPLTHITVLFFPTPHSTTEVHAVHTGWRSSAEWEEARQSFVSMWDYAFGELKKKINA
ncbi:SRPBCC domain-containing protein [bacterium]|nr:SRPBCC domain-containing protein [bacterium]